MADDGLTTGQIPATELIDDVIGNRAGSACRIQTENLAAQLAETGSMAAKFQEYYTALDQAVEEAEGYRSDAQMAREYVGSAALPIGARLPWGFSSVPNTFLPEDGRAVTSDYPDLRQMLIDEGSPYGTDGNGDPYLRDTRGMFVRGLDDGAGVDPGRDLHTDQADQMQQITGSFVTRASDSGIAAGAFNTSSTSSVSRHEGSGANGQLVEFDSADSPGARVGDETRPVNFAAKWIIKAYHAYSNLSGKVVALGTAAEEDTEAFTPAAVVNAAGEDRFSYGGQVDLVLEDAEGRAALVVDRSGTVLGRLGIRGNSQIAATFNTETGETDLAIAPDIDNLPLPGGAAASNDADDLYVDGDKMDVLFRDDDQRAAFGILSSGGVGAYRIKVAGMTFEPADAPLYLDGKQLMLAIHDPDLRIALAVAEDGTITTHGRQDRWLLDEVALFGDSMTAPTQNTDAWAEVTGLPVYNYGIGGQASPQIMGRFGSTVYGVTMEDDEITAGSNVITHFDGAAPEGMETGSGMQPLILSTPASLNDYGSPHYLPEGVVIGGVRGTLSRSATDTGGSSQSDTEVYTFTPDEAESDKLPMRVPPGQPMVVPQRVNHRRIVVFGGLANDDPDTYDVTWENLQAAVELLKANGNYRFIVLTIPTSAYGNMDAGDPDRAALDDINSKIIKTWPENSFDQARWLVSYGIQAGIDAGYLPDDGSVPTAQDDADIANDIIPSSLRKDNIHWEDWVYNLIVPAIYVSVFQPKGWV